MEDKRQEHAHEMQDAHAEIAALSNEIASLREQNAAMAEESQHWQAQVRDAGAGLIGCVI